MSEVKALEHSTLIVPYEVLNRTFRNAQKQIDRDVSHVNSANDKLRKILSNSTATVEDACSELDELVNKLHALKNKSNDALDQEKTKLFHIQKRVSYLKDQSDSKKSIIWKHHRLNRILVDHFLRNGYYDSAIMLAETSEVQHLVDTEQFSAAKQVEKTLKEKNPAVCLQWCHSNKSKLKKLQSTLELNVRIQEFVELVKSEERKDALIYARKHFSGNTPDSLAIPEIQKTVMALLAFKPNTEIKRYKELFDATRWDLLVEQFRRENLSLYQLNSQSTLEIVLQSGLASLKTPHCFHEDEQKRDCPVCNRLFNKLAKPLPFAHSSHSRLLCNHTGYQMNEHNPPMMLPNGHVYSETAIHRLSSMSDQDSIVCPRSKSLFTKDEVKKIYIM